MCVHFTEGAPDQSKEWGDGQECTWPSWWLDEGTWCLDLIYVIDLELLKMVKKNSLFFYARLSLSTYFFASSLTQWRGPTDTTIPQPIVSTCTPLRSQFPRPHPPHHQQSNRKHLKQLSQMPVTNGSGSSLNWNAPTPPPISARTWERRPRKRPPPQPLPLSYPPLTGTLSKEHRCFVMVTEM